MGKHSANDSSTFWKSMAISLLKWTILAVIPIAVAAGIWRVVQIRQAAPPTAVPTASPSIAPVSLEPSPLPTVPLETVPPPEPSPSPSPALKVQVLNGSSRSPNAGTALAEKLTNEGYEVVSVEKAVKTYPATTVFYQKGFKPQADELAKLLKTARVAPAPSSLDPSIPLTVVAGNDYRD